MQLSQKCEVERHKETLGPMEVTWKGKESELTESEKLYYFKGTKALFGVEVG